MTIDNPAWRLTDTDLFLLQIVIRVATHWGVSDTELLREDEKYIPCARCICRCCSS